MEARNRLLRRHGFSPVQIALGSEDEVPGCLLDDPPQIVGNSVMVSGEETEFVKTLKYRHAAMQAMIKEADNRAMREALNARPRVMREFEAKGGL